MQARGVELTPAISGSAFAALFLSKLAVAVAAANAVVAYAAVDNNQLAIVHSCAADPFEPDSKIFKSAKTLIRFFHFSQILHQ